MWRRLVIGVVALALLALPGAASSLVGISRFRTVETLHRRAGSLELWSSRVLLLRDAQAIGVGVVACDHVGTLAQCAGTYVLPSGQVTVQGSFSSRDRIVFAITGGTGTYAGVRGVSISTQTFCCPRKALLTFYFS